MLFCLRFFSLRHVVVLLCVALFGSTAALAQAPGGRKIPPPSVTIQTITLGDATLVATLPGRVSASREAEVRPQVAGIVTKRLFEEDNAVEVGDPLYQIDAETYKAQVAEAEAQVAKAEADLELARNNESRKETLLERQLASAQTFENIVTSRKLAEAQLMMAKAQLRRAQITLDRTTIRAPLAGVIGFSKVNEGALVGASQANAMTTIRTIDPVHVDVTQSAAEFLDWRRKNKEKSQQGREVTLILANGVNYEIKGSLAAADTHVDEATGVVTLRVQFANPDRILLPGMYVQVRLPQGIIKQAALVPQKAVIRDRRGQPLAWLVNSDNVIEPRPLTIIQDQGNQWIVSAGLEDGDRLMVDGFAKARPGATVNPAEAGAVRQNNSTAPKEQ